MHEADIPLDEEKGERTVSTSSSRNGSKSSGSSLEKKKEYVICNTILLLEHSSLILETTGLHNKDARRDSADSPVLSLR